MRVSYADLLSLRVEVDELLASALSRVTRTFVAHITQPGLLRGGLGIVHNLDFTNFLFFLAKLAGGDRHASNTGDEPARGRLALSMKILETERLVLSHLTIADASFMLELMNEPEFIEFVADRGLRTEAEAALYLAEKILPSYEKFGFGLWRVDLKQSAAPIGIAVC